jgi:modulator of FtsH protease
MSAAYQPDAWFDFYVAAAGVCAALWGLVFVAISLHPREISAHPVLRNRARATLVGLCLLLILSLVCLIPRQSRLALGVELTLIWLLWLGTVAAGTIQLLGRLRQVDRDFWWRTGTGTLMGLCGLAAGVTLAWGRGGGLLWNVVASVLGLMLTLASAWSISFGPQLEDDGRDLSIMSAGAAVTTEPVPIPEAPTPISTSR